VLLIKPLWSMFGHGEDASDVILTYRHAGGVGASHLVFIRACYVCM